MIIHSRLRYNTNKARYSRITPRRKALQPKIEAVHGNEGDIKQFEMRSNSASFAIDDEKMTVRAQRPDEIGAQFDRPIQRATTQNLLATPH
jgi:hypothetical protein